MYTRVLQEEDRAAQGRFVRFVPRVEAVRSSRGSVRIEGVPRHALPPCIALERGNSLQDWGARTELQGAEYTAQCCVVCTHAKQCWVIGPQLLKQIWFHLSNFQRYFPNNSC